MARKALRKESYRSVAGYVAATNACGKVAHHNRKQAKQAVKRTPGERMRAYRCPGCSLWHVGHLPFVVRRGHTSSHDWYARPTRRAA